MPSVTINIVGQGTPTIPGGSSDFGHMWYTLTDDNGNSFNYGFAPVDGATGISRAFGPGQVHPDDNTTYTGPREYTKTIEITPQQYDAMKNFGDNPASGGFSTYYNGISNSCIDFTWRALAIGGLNPSGFEGDILPHLNADDVAAIGTRSNILFDDLKRTVVEYLSKLKESISTLFSEAQRAVFRYDPLTFDLDGDGLETVGAAQSGVSFDHNGDGIREGTGWVLSDDGFLVLDRNGNGTIDMGAELFGDSTPLGSGGTATDGFAALAQEDTNADGVVNATDAHFADLRIWRDLNQDGVSQSGELFTLTALGIASINVAAAEHSQVLSDGNRIADLGSYTKTDGSTGTVGDVGKMADIDLSADTFHREFTDHIPLVAGVDALPDMQASGKVRDLREAASQSSDLYGVLATYSAMTTRAGQFALLDTFIEKWAETADMSTMEQRATSALATGQNPYGYGLKWDSVGSKRAGDFVTGHGPGNEPIYDPEWIATVQQFERQLYILEAFNGRHFFQFPWETPDGAAAIEGMWIDEAPIDPNTGVATEAAGFT